jgi:tetratricopeptide (TPR) repeat protein
LTLHKLKRLLDPAIPATPYATLGDPDCGPFASSQSKSSSASSRASESAGKPPSQLDALEANDQSGATKGDAASPSEPVLPEHIATLYAELETSEGDEMAVHGIAMKAMDIAPDAIRSPDEAEHLLRIAGLLADPNALDPAIAWSRAVIGAFPTSAEVLSMGAMVGSQWQMLSGEAPPEPLHDDALVAMFQRAMDMNVQSPKPFYRAGAYHFGKQNLSEAERCLARAFRLDRQHSMAARTLAKVYNYTDRPRDALHVLDMCLREGTDDPNVAWEAALQANTVGHYAAMLTYLDRFEALVDRQPWCDYYRALALQELSRPAEALDALDRELALNPDAECGVMMQRASALALVGDSESMRAALQRVLETPFGNMDSITKHGLIQLFRRLWRSVETALPPQDAMRQALEQKMLDGCIAPDEMLEAMRIGDPETAEQPLRYFQVYLKQPLGQDWANSAGCLPGEQDWSECITLWRVLARDEEHARELSLTWQAKSFRDAASVEFIEQGDQEYIDRPGIVGQGPRYMPDPMAEENG